MKGNKGRPRSSDPELKREPVGPLCLRMQRGIGHPVVIRRVASLEDGLEQRERLLASGEWFRVIVWRHGGSSGLPRVTTTAEVV